MILRQDSETSTRTRLDFKVPVPGPGTRSLERTLYWLLDDPKRILFRIRPFIASHYIDCIASRYEEKGRQLTKSCSEQCPCQGPVPKYYPLVLRFLLRHQTKSMFRLLPMPASCTRSSSLNGALCSFQRCQLIFVTWLIKVYGTVWREVILLVILTSIAKLPVIFQSCVHATLACFTPHRVTNPHVHCLPLTFSKVLR